MAFVLDASVVLAWHFDDEDNAVAEYVADRSADEIAIVPAHWFAEVANGLLAGERRKRTDANGVHRFIGRLEVLKLESEASEASAAFDRLLPLARNNGLTVYDAAYLDLAMRRGLPLATLDRALAAAARTAGIQIIESEAL